jgi:uncharacterized protein (TIRG00374 family)
MKRAIAFAALFGLIGLAATLWLLGENISSLGRIPFSAIAIGVGLLLLNYLAATVRLKMLVGMANHDLSLVACLRAYALGLFTSAVTPGSAGQAPAVVLSLTRDGMPASRAWSVNVYVWVLDLVLLAYSVPISLLLVGRSLPVLRIDRPELLALGVAAATAALIWVLLFRLHWLTTLVKALFRLRWLRRWQPSIVDFTQRLEAATLELRGGSLAIRVALHALTAVIYFSTMVTFWVMVDAVNPGAKLFQTMATAQIPTVLAAFFPTPGGAGILEILTASLMRASTARDVAAAILGWRLITFYSRLVIGPALGAARVGMQRPGAEPRHAEG